MATLADELLNDFEDTGSEGEDDQSRTIFEDELPDNVTNGHATKALRHDSTTGEMALDGDEEGAEDEDEEMTLGANIEREALEDAQDEEETKAKVEKMQLGGVSDVRNVAGLMKTLQPVLEVSDQFSYPQSSKSCRDFEFTSLVAQS